MRHVLSIIFAIVALGTVAACGTAHTTAQRTTSVTATETPGGYVATATAGDATPTSGDVTPTMPPNPSNGGIPTNPSGGNVPAASVAFMRATTTFTQWNASLTASTITINGTVQTAPFPTIPVSGTTLYQVPQDCATSQTNQYYVDRLAYAKVQALVPASNIGLEYDISNPAYTCSPAAGTQSSSPGSYVLIETFTGTLLYGDVATQCKSQAAAYVASQGYKLATLSYSDGIEASIKNNNFVMTCRGSILGIWNGSYNTAAIAKAIAGMIQDNAINYVKGVPGVDPSSVEVAVSRGIYLPSDPSQIVFYLPPAPRAA